MKPTSSIWKRFAFTTNPVGRSNQTISKLGSEFNSRATAGRRSNVFFHRPIATLIGLAVPDCITIRRHIYKQQRSLSGDSNSSPISDKDVETFRELLNHKPGSVLTKQDEVDPYNTDWTKHYKGESRVVLRPQSTEEVSAILRYCHEKYIGVVPQAGNTGLVGGGVPIEENEVIVSVERMNRIISWNPTTGILTGEAGVVLQDWQEYAQTQNVIVPVDLGSKGSCLIGGNVSTNAGGQYFARYKSLHANVVGLEVVLAGGEVHSFNLKQEADSPNVICNLKDNTGYDLKHLFIGSEGTLGIITKVALWCSAPYPTSRSTVLCACTSLEQVQESLQGAKSALGETLAAFEFMDRSVMEWVASNPNASSDGHGMIPTDSNGEYYPYYILVETHGTNSEHDGEKMQRFLEESLDQGGMSDGVLSSSLSQVNEMWRIRESCNPTVASHGYTYKYDVSLPIEEFANFSKKMAERITAMTDCGCRITNWGHIMDGNLHFNVTTPGKFERDASVLEALEPYIFDTVIAKGGSISAEHGLGQSKSKYLPMIHDKQTLSLMHSIKMLMDPRGIMNRNKFLPPRS